MKKLSQKELNERIKKVVNAIKKCLVTEEYYIITYEKIANEINLSKDKVRRVLVFLQENGYVKIEKSIAKFGTLLVTGVKFLKEYDELER